MVNKFMVKCLIVYFSVGGTTKNVADKIVAGLESVGYTVDLHNLTDDVPPSIENYDLLGIGSPAYFVSLPFNVADYLKTIPKLNIPFFSFILYGFVIGDGGNRLRKKLTKKGGRDVGYLKTRGREDFYGFVKSGYALFPNSPNAEDLERAENFGKSIKSNIENENYIPEEFDERPPFMFRFQRAINAKWITQLMLYKMIKVNKSKCTKCGICVNICPTHNIVMDDSGFPKIGKDCLGCYYCERDCPEEAITSILDTKMAKPILKYNENLIPKVVGDNYERVQLINGKVEKI